MLCDNVDVISELFRKFLKTVVSDQYLEQFDSASHSIHS